VSPPRRLSWEQFALQEGELAKGPAVHGWKDQRWTLERIKTVIGRRFHVSYTIQGVRKLLLCGGWSCQVLARRALERDDALAVWVKEVWPRAEASRRPVEPG
jgi:transposase